MVATNATDAAPINFALRQAINAFKSRSTDDAVSLGWQAKWFKDRLVTTVGYRTDDTKSYGVPTMRDYIDPAIPGAATNPLQRFFSPSRLVPLNAAPSIIGSGISRTYAAVYHALPWLSLTYNQSQNFSPVGSASWRNFQDEPATSSLGETKDYGLRFYLFDGKLSVSANRFTNSATDQARAANSFSGSSKNILTRLRTNYKEPGDSHFTAMGALGAYAVDAGSVSDTWSFEAKGYELNVVYNLTSSWRAAVTGSINENALGPHLTSLGKYLATSAPYNGLATWRNYVTELRKVAAGEASSAFDLNPDDPAARSNASADATFIEAQANSAERVYLDERAIEGAVTHRNGKYALNGVAAYTCPEDGKLKGWSVGGNFRWRSANTVGYQRELNSVGIPAGSIDVSRPIKGDDFWDVGAMIAHRRRIFKNVTWRLQLNIENLFDWQKARVVGVDSDTESVYGAANTLVPIRWELRRPRNFVLTSTFEF